MCVCVCAHVRVHVCVHGKGGGAGYQGGRGRVEGQSSEVGAQSPVAELGGLRGGGRGGEGMEGVRREGVTHCYSTVVPYK